MVGVGGEEMEQDGRTALTPNRSCSVYLASVFKVPCLIVLFEYLIII